MAPNLRGGPLPCGHYIAEEAPDRLLDEVFPFFASGD
jgi:haloacetate dehalogenase